MGLTAQGVHCEDACLSVSETLMQAGASSSSQLSTAFFTQCSTTAPQQQRVTKSESPRIDDCAPAYAAPVLDDMTRSDATDAEPRAQFTLYTSDNESDPDTHPAVVMTTTTTGGKTARERGRERSKARFKKMLRPLRRSHSAGCNKDVPAHALFLRHKDQQLHKAKSEIGRRSIDAGLHSMDRPSSDSDTDEQKDASKKTSGGGGGGGSLKVKKKSLAKDVKDKLAFLRRRHTETTLRSRDGKDGSKCSMDKALSWSKSFDNLLSDKNGLELFREFLRSEFSEENIEFWIACEQFKNTNSNKMQTEAQKIYADYVAVQAPHEINLDSKTRMVTLKGLSSVTRQSFTVAQKRIQALMEKDSYRRFLQSDVYLQLVGSNRGRSSAT